MCVYTHTHTHTGVEFLNPKEIVTHSSILAWEIPRQKSLAGCDPWGHKDSNTT